MDAAGQQPGLINEAFLRGVVDALPSEVVVRDAESRILFANSAFGSTYDRTAHEVIGLRDADLWAEFGRPAAQIEGWLAEDREIMASGVTREYVEKIERPSGEVVYFHNVKQPIILADGTRCLLAMYTDVTARETAEEKVREARAHSAELAGIHKTAVTYAHEINNPLTGILGLAQVLLDGDAAQPDAGEMLAEIKAAALRIRDVIRKLERINEPRTKPYLNHSQRLDLEDEE